MAVKILTDSNADLTKDLYNKYDIDVFPLIVIMDGKEYLDRVNVEPIDVLNYMRKGGVAKTNQVSYKKFEDEFKKLADSKDSYIYIAFSSELSGTCQTAMLVESEMREKYPDFDLTVIDTKCASLGQGLVVLKAAKMAKEGKSKEEIIETVKHDALHMEHIFTVDDLQYLFRGGRVSRTSMIIGNLLSVKPVLNVEDGKLIPFDKVRGRKKALRRLVDQLDIRGNKINDQLIGINHADDIEAVEYLKELILEKYNPKEILVTDIGCSIGAHTGPGVISLYFLNEVV